MSKPAKRPRKGPEKRPERGLKAGAALAQRPLIAVCLFAAFCISVYLAWGSAQGGGIPGCGPESDCDKVLTSRWAYLFGLPISYFALPIYLSGLVFLFKKPIAWLPLFGVAVIILFAAVWFVGLQLVAIRAFCKFCLTAHVAGGIGAVLLLRQMKLERRSAMPVAAAAGIASALLIVAQAVSAPRGPVVISSGTSSTGSSSVSATAPETVATQIVAAIPEPPPTFTILDGQFTLNLKEVPVTGRLDAPKKIVKLFDYTCHHCRDTHRALEPVRKSYSHELAVISLPVPLESDCNPLMKRTSSAHLGACELTKIALAVFLADPTKFEEFSNWLFEPETPPGISPSRDFAGKLVGVDRLNAALADSRITNQIRLDIDIYTANSRRARQGTLPQLIFPRNAIFGAVTDRAEMEKIVADGFKEPALVPSATQ
jgi:uncharacterized membrane protein